MTKANRNLSVSAQNRQRPGVPSSTQAIIVCCCLIAATWAVFGQTLSYDFVNYDDDVYVYHNPEVVRGFTSQTIRWAFTSIYAANWHPLTWLSHMLDCELWGIRPAGHHFTNVLLHSINAALLFLVLRKMTGGFWQSAVVAALFALHPQRVESVAWIAERKDVLSGLFFILTLAAYTHYVCRPASVLRYLLVVLTLALGLMSKPSLVVAPFILLLLDYWPFGRLSAESFSRRPPNSSRPSSVWRLVVEKLPLVALCAASGGATLFAQKYSVTVGGGLPIASRIENAIISYLAYLGQMVWPVRLAVLYPHPGTNLPIWQVAAALFVLILITIGVFIFGKNHRYLITGWLWYVVMLLPMIGLIQVGFQSRADRYTYLAHIGLYLMVAWTVSSVLNFTRNRRRMVWIGATTVLLLLGWCARRQCGFWRDSESLWTHTLAVTSVNAVAHNNLGNFYLDHNRLDDARQQYRASLEISAPVAAHTTQLGLLERAYADAENNLGMVLVRTGRETEGIDCYQRVLDRFPDNPKAHLNLGNIALDRGRRDDAIGHYTKALFVFPQYADALFNLGNALAQKGDLDQAIVRYKQALEVQPSFEQADNNLGIALLTRGSVSEAVTHWREALRLQPDSVDILNNLAWVLATHPQSAIRDGRGAVALAQRANQLSGNNNPAFLRTLGAACAEAGDFSAASDAAARGAQSARISNNRALAVILDDDQAHYKAGEPIRTASRPENERSP